MKNRKEKVSSNVIFLGIASLLNDMSSEMILPILPMFIKMLGGNEIVVGLVGGLRDSISSISTIFSGYWSDKVRKRKVFVYLGYLFSSLFKLFLAFSKTWHYVAILFGLERIGKGLRTAPRDAIIADSMPGKRGEGFGIHRALDTSGGVIGALATFFIFWFFKVDFRFIMFLAAVVAFLSLIPLVFVRWDDCIPGKTSLRINLKILPLRLKLFIIIAGIFSLANFSYMFFILKAQSCFVGKLSIGIPILLYVLYNIFYALLAVFLGVLTDKIGRAKIIALGYFLFSITSFGFFLFNSMLAFIILFITYGLVYAMIKGNQLAYISDLSPKPLKATVLGTFHGVIGIVTLLSSLIAGFLWYYISPEAIFIYGGVVSILSVLLFIIFRNNFK